MLGGLDEEAIAQQKKPFSPATARCRTGIGAVREPGEGREGDDMVGLVMARERSRCQGGEGKEGDKGQAAEEPKAKKQLPVRRPHPDNATNKLKIPVIQGAIGFWPEIAMVPALL